MDSRVKELFERYQAGKASEQEIKLVEEWFAEFDGQPQETLSSEKKAVIFSRMDSEMDKMLYPRPKIRFLGNHWLQAAAVLLICFSFFLFKTFRKPANTEAPVTYTFVSAGKGVKKQFFLSDGTHVYLNSGSVIRIASNYGVKNRVVSLNGEAFFEVQHNAAKPFSIHSGKLVISDIGTAFDVKAYTDEAKIQVAVESGRVSVAKSKGGNRQEVVASLLTPNQQLTFDNQTENHVLSHTQSNELSAWKLNRLSFDNSSMEEIAHSLERWYNVTVKLNKDVDEHHRYTVSFNNEPVNDVLKVLQRLTGMTYQVNDRTISINLKNSKKS